MISVAIIDDHSLFSQSLAAILQSCYPDIKVVFITDQPARMLSFEFDKSPDVVLLDVHLHEASGYQFVEAITAKFPNTRIIMLSGNLSEFTIQQGVNVGVYGFLSKDTTHEEVYEALQLVVADGKYIGKSVQKLFNNAMMHRETQLSQREIEIVKLLCQGLTHKEIGEKLFISPRTVEAHRNNILAKLNLDSIAGLVAFAVKNGII